MIFCDDSGWGCLLGGVMIGVYNTDGRKFKSALIPVKYFQGKQFATGRYRMEALGLFLRMFPKMGNTDKIQVCRGTVLDDIYGYMLNKGWGKNLIRDEIGEPLQSLLEEKFAQSLVKVGVPRKTTGAHCLSFDDQVKWALENKKHLKHVKTGWSSWKNKYSKTLFE